MSDYVESDTKKVTRSTLEQLKQFTKIVADTGNFEEIKKYKPNDATTNPSLILSASNMKEYKLLLNQAVKYGNNIGNTDEEKIMYALDKLFVLFGCQILETIPGRVSTEIDARLSFDCDGSVQKALKIIALYKEMGIDKSRVYIKLAATWEGIKAASILETEHGINCNMTLIFSLIQAIACGVIGKATLISPFVGRVSDWYLKSETANDNKIDQGVLLVTNIFNYFKQFGFKTDIMGASFRNTNQIIQLAGCDLLTISPALLEELANSTNHIEKVLDESKPSKTFSEKINIDEKTFRWMLNEDRMANELLSNGINRFAADTRKLEEIIKDMLNVHD